MEANKKKTGDSKVLKEALHTIRELRKRLDEAGQKKNEPIAITGMACRFPGGCDTPEVFWEFLKRGGDGIGEIPSSRWDAAEFYDPDPDAAGKMYVKEAGFLEGDVAQFDARFFGISPKEAIEMDPQHRLLLEVSWEALERAGLAPDRLNGSRTGIFVGLLGSEYGSIPRETKDSNPYAATGLALNTASGRISHLLGLHGPAISLDTACSSSLVGVHLACDSLRRGECSIALAGGAGLMLTPYTFLMLSDFRALAKDGRSKTFDASADGYGRGEGCGMVVLKTLSRALEDGDPVLAVIKGSALNHDGSSSGLTVPNGRAQRELYQLAFAESGVSPADIGYLETHGTGTELGDPIELRSVAEVFGKGRPSDSPLMVGSVKANIGHLEAAAGIASLIKTVLCLRHREIPPQVNFKHLNPKIDLDKIPAKIPTAATPWTANGTPLLSAVSSFGFSGTNAHLVLSEAPVRSVGSNESVKLPIQLLVLSAKSTDALSDLTWKFKEYLDEDAAIDCQDFAFTANVGRAQLPYRTAVLATDRDGMLEMLDAASAGDDTLGEIFSGHCTDETRLKTGFFFSGEADSFNVKQALEFYKSYPVFREAMADCDDLFDKYLDLKPSAILHAEGVDRAMPSAGKALSACIFSLNYCLAVLWSGFGLAPSAIMGHRVGALAAACYAGVMPLDTAARLTAASVDKNVEAGAPELAMARYPYISAVSGDSVSRDSLQSVSFWLKEAEANTGKVSEGMEKIYGLGCAVCVDVAAGTLRENGAVDTAQGNGPLWTPVFKSLARLFCLGASIDWNGVYHPFGRRKLQLPTYPFQRRHFWIDALPFGSRQVQALVEEEKTVESGNPYDARPVPSPLSAKQYEFRLDVEEIPDITDSMGALHVGYYQQLLASAVKTAYGHLEYTVKDFSFLATLPVADVIRKSIYVILNPNDDNSVNFEFYTQDFSKKFWTLHAHGNLILEREGGMEDMAPGRLEEIKARCTKEMGTEEFYDLLENRLLKLGPGLRWIDRVWYREGEALARFRLPNPEEKLANYGLLHPGIWDSCSQLFFVSFSDKIDKSAKYMMVNWKDFVFDCVGKDDELWCYINLSGNPDERGFVVGTFELFDKEGRFVAKTSETSLKEVPQEAYDAFKAQAEKDRSQQQEGKNEALLATLRGLSIQKGALELSVHLKERMARLLGMLAEDLDIKEPLRNVGMDSLVGLDFKKEIESELGIEIPIETLIQGPSIFQLAESLIHSLPGERPQQRSSSAVTKKKRGYSMEPQRWIDGYNERTDAKFRLFCLPYGGRGASAFKNWQGLLPEEVDVCAIQLPGREDRLKEPPIKTMDELSETLEEVLSPKMNIPFGFYGHSFGCFISYNLTSRLMRENKPLPCHLFLGGCSAPQISPNPILSKITAAFKNVGIDQLPDPDVAGTFTVEQLRVFLNSPEMKVISKQDEEIARALIPTVLSDVGIVKSYKFVPDESFAVPITCFHGLTDEDVAEEEMRAWAELTTGNYNIHLLPGDHFFLNENKDLKDLVALIGTELKPYLK